MKPSQSAKSPSKWMLLVEFPAATALFMIASLNLAYRPMLLITIAIMGLLVACYLYFKLRYGIRIPLFVLFLAFAAVEVDTVGNHFRWYQRIPWPIPYDVFAHLVIPVLLSPALIWLIRAWFEKSSYAVPLSVVVFIATCVNFSLSGFYEITEMWDELYFGGKRIWSIYDTSRDLQWDLTGAIFGSLLTFAAIKLRSKFFQRQVTRKLIADLPSTTEALKGSQIQVSGRK